MWLVESFLEKLRRRNWRFWVIFFEEDAELCLPPFADGEHRPKYLLARAMTIRHLQANLASQHSFVGVQVFRSSDSGEFLNFLLEKNLMTIMMDDGSAMDFSCQENHRIIIPLRRKCRGLIDNGVSIARMDGVEWKSAQVSQEIFILEMSATLIARKRLTWQSSKPLPEYKLLFHAVE